MYKAMFFDVDGTLLSFETHKMPPSTLESLHRLREKGIKLFLGTGRHPAMLGGLMREFPFDGMVALTGQYCTMGDQVLHSNPIQREHMTALLAAAEQLKFPTVFLAEGEIFTGASHPDIDHFLEHLDLEQPKLRPLSYALEKNVYQVICFLGPDRQQELFDIAPGLSYTRWCPDFLDIIPEGGGKDVGLQIVMDHLGITREEVMAFGDGENDLAMIRHAGTGVVMGSGTEYLKSLADYVTGTVDEDGIYHALNHYGVL